MYTCHSWFASLLGCYNQLKRGIWSEQIQVYRLYHYVDFLIYNLQPTTDNLQLSSVHQLARVR